MTMTSGRASALQLRKRIMRTRSEKGAALLEAAITIPILLLIAIVLLPVAIRKFFKPRTSPNGGGEALQPDVD